MLSLVWTGHALAAEEAQVKAEFVERFTRFIEWPQSAIPPDDSPFVVCVFGESPLSAQLEGVLAKRKIHDRGVRLKRLSDGAPVADCHILYVAPSARAQVSRIVGELKGKPVLSVGDTNGFAELGLVINLYVDEHAHVRFEINAEAAKASGLQISAKLMTLAKQSGGGGPPP